MNISSLIDFCKQNYPERTIDLCEAIDLIIDTLNNLKSDLGKSMPTLVDNDEFDSIDEYKNHAKTIAQIIQNLNNISNNITIDDMEDDEPEAELKNSDSIDINYNDKSFNADSNIPHTLYEDFTYTKPAGIEIESTYLEANEWRDVFNKCCQYLLNKNTEIFLSFLSDPAMQGRKCKYFSYDSNELREGVRVKGSKIYIEYNVSATFVRNIIIKMLEKYEIPKRNCHIFIRRDLTSLHSDNAKLQETTHKLEESDDEIKIGQYAKEYFVSYFQSHTSESEIKNFTDKDWCHDTFGICYPILKQVDTKLPISEQVNYNNQYRRYYSSPVLKINENDYIICSQWFAQFKPKLINWINSNSVNPFIINEDEKIAEIEDKLKFNKNFNSISIPKILFVDILKTISGYGERSFETGYLSEMFNVRILRESTYEKSQHVINNIRKYLESEDIISLYANSKKGKYVVSDFNKLQLLIQKYDTEANITIKNNEPVKSEVVIYSYYDKKQIVIDLNNSDDEYFFLHNYCINKKAGDKFSVQSKEYVIVNFKKNRSTNAKIIINKDQENDKKKRKVCIQCGEPVFHNSQYCWEHYKYHNAESK